MSELARPHLASFQLDLLARHIGTSTRKVQRKLEKQIGKPTCAELFGSLFAQCDQATCCLAAAATELLGLSCQVPSDFSLSVDSTIHADQYGSDTEMVQAHGDTIESSSGSQVPQERIAALVDDRLECMLPLLVKILNAHLNGQPLEPLLDEVLRRNVAAHPCDGTADSMVSELSSKQLRKKQRRGKRAATRAAAAGSQRCDGTERAVAVATQDH